jgi:hypothetical protein
MTYLPKNFGFNEKGRISFRYIGYDPILDQRGLEKSEMMAPKMFNDIDLFIEEGLHHNH